MCRRLIKNDMAVVYGLGPLLNLKPWFVLSRILTAMRASMLSCHYILFCSAMQSDLAACSAGDDVDPEEYRPEVLDETVPTSISHLVEVTSVAVLWETPCPCHGATASRNQTSVPAASMLR